MNYEPSDMGGIRSIKTLTSGTGITFHARHISQERTGVHAELGVAVNKSLGAFTYCNALRQEERLRLAKEAHKVLGEVDAGLYPLESLRHDLDLFCYGLWDAYMDTVPADLTPGSEAAIPPDFLLKPFILNGGGSIVFAPPGRGKSYLGLLWAVCIDAGISDFWPVQQKRVLFLNLERSKLTIVNRLGAINEALGLDRTRGLRCIHARGKSLSDILLPAQRTIERENIGLVVVDSISRAGRGDLTENKVVNTIIDDLNTFPSWLGLAHTPRQSEDHIFGGVHFDAGADVIVQLLSQSLDNGKLGLGLKTTKANDFRPAPLSIMALEFGDLELEAIRPAKEHEFIMIEAQKVQNIGDRLYDYLLEYGESTASKLAEALDYHQGHISETLKTDRRFVLTRTGPKNQRFYGVKARPEEETT